MTVVKKTEETSEETSEEWMSRRWDEKNKRWKRLASARLDIAEYEDNEAFDAMQDEREAFLKVASLVSEYLRSKVPDADEDVIDLVNRASDLAAR